MDAEATDVAVIGAGPAGMAAALAACAQGCAVTVLDEQAAPGGQIHRGILSATPARLEALGEDYAQGRDLAQRFTAAPIRHLRQAAVWQVTREREIHYVADGASRTLRANQIVLATGAMERPFPIPGWTLPGVMTAGAAQILMKGAGVVPQGPFVLAGCGPLLYLLAAQLLRAGAPPSAIVDSVTPDAYWRALPHLPRALAGWRDLAKGIELLRNIGRAGIRHWRGADDFAIEGEGEARALRFRHDGREHRIEARTVLLHQGVVPNVHATLALRARHAWSDAQQCFVPVADAWGELDVAGIRIAGDGGGIVGAAAAEEQGTLAGLAAAQACGRLDAEALDRLSATPRRRLARHRAVRPLLDALYRAPASHRIPADAVTICRCEEVNAGELRSAVALGATGPNQAKAYVRCGMGPCQGRLCGLTVTEVIARETARPPAEVGHLRIRPPLKPLPLTELAAYPTIGPEVEMREP